MKKRESLILCMLLVTIVLSLSLISATIDIDLKKDTYYQGETLQATITGSFVENLKPENIGLYGADSSHKLPTESNLVKTEENTYLYYATLPETTGNYYLKIENTKYLEIATELDTPVYKNFTMTSTNNSYLAINPGFIYTSTDFEVTIKAYNKNQQVTVECAATGTKETFSLGYMSTKTISFPIDNIKKATETTVKVNSYSIPATISPKIPSTPETTNESRDNLKNLLAPISPINVTILKNVDYHFPIDIFNKARIPVDINLTTSSKELKIIPIQLDNFDDEARLNLTIYTASDFKGNITLISSEGNVVIPVNVITTTKPSEVNFSDTPPLNRPQTCAEFNGKKCSSDTTCDGSTIYASDGNCCVGACVSPSSSKTWLWGLLILVILGAGAYLLYKRSNNQELSEKFNDIFKKKTEDYKNKINPKIEEPKEVRKSLGNI